MEKVQEELDNKFGNEQELVSWSDRSSLPYTCAVVNVSKDKGDLFNH